MAGLKGWFLDFLKDGLKDYLIEQLKALPGRALWASIVAGAFFIWEPLRSWAMKDVTASQWELAVPYVIAVALLVGGIIGGIKAQRKVKAAPTREQLQEANDKLAEQQKTLAAREFVLSVHEEDITKLTGQIHSLMKERDRLKEQWAAKHATALASSLTAAKKITDLETAIADLRSQNAALKQELQDEMQANTGARAAINDQAKRRIDELNKQISELRGQLAVAKQQRPIKADQNETPAGKVLKRMDQASLRKTDQVPEPIVDRDYKEVSLDGIHWRWNYLPPHNQVVNVKAYCDHCDYVLELGAAGHDEEGYLSLGCPKCGTRVRVPSVVPRTIGEKATAEIERRIRNGLWMKDLAANQARASAILNDADRHSPVWKRA